MTPAPAPAARRSRRLAAALAVLALGAGVAACGTTSDSPGGPGTGGGARSGAIGLLLPETKTSRYEAFDHPLFKAKLAALCPRCKLLYANSNQDAAQQQAQAESMLTQGAKVLVLDPVDGKAAQAIVNRAKAQHVSVVSYDRLAGGPVDNYVSFDNERVGQLQAQELLRQLRRGGSVKRGPIVMINGAKTDPNAALFKRGAHSVLDGQVTIGKEYDTPDWSPDQAQTEAEQAITSLGRDRIIGFYSANDGMASGIAASIKNAGFRPFPPLTGQDAQRDGIRRILTGEQSMTVYKAIKPEAEAAAAMAVALLRGEPYPAATARVDNGTRKVPSVLLTPVAITRANIAATVIRDGFYTVGDLCTARYAAACRKAGVR